MADSFRGVLEGQGVGIALRNCEILLKIIRSIYTVQATKIFQTTVIFSGGSWPSIRITCAQK